MGRGRRLPLEQVLLGFLMQEPMHGYDLYGHAERELGRVWTMGMSNVYGALKRLEEKGWAESSLRPQEGRPDRRVYRITPAGRESFLRWVRSPVPTMHRLRVEFLAKLYFLRALALEGVPDLLAAQEAVCRERIERFRRSADREGARAFDRRVFDLRLRQIEAVIEWLQAYRQEPPA